SEDCRRARNVTGVQTCAPPIYARGRSGQLDLPAGEEVHPQRASRHLDGRRRGRVDVTGPEPRPDRGGADTGAAGAGLPDAAFVDAHRDAPRAEDPDELDVAALRRHWVDRRRPAQPEAVERDVLRERDDGVRVAEVERERGVGLGDLLDLLDVDEGVEAVGVRPRLVDEMPGAHVGHDLVPLKTDASRPRPRRERELVADQTLPAQPPRDDTGAVAA